MPAIEPIPLPAIEAARARISGLALRTPLIPLDVDGPARIFLKLECLQPIGSFKLRGAGNAMALCTRAQLEGGVYTASAGNMAQGVAWVARARGLPCSVVIPDHAPAAKREAIARLGAEAIAVPFRRWWRVIDEGSFAGLSGHFIHPVRDPAVIAGNGTIGLEILEDLPDVDAVVVPFGGGGLITGIASAIRAKKPDTEVVSAEVATAAPLAGALRIGEPHAVEYTTSFVDGIGSMIVLPDMWPVLRRLVDRAVIAWPEEIAEAIRTLVTRARVVAEGAGAAPVAAVLSGLFRESFAGKRVVCVVSGGNLDHSLLAAILRGECPSPGEAAS